MVDESRTSKIAALGFSKLFPDLGQELHHEVYEEVTGNRRLLLLLQVPILFRWFLIVIRV